MNLISRIEFVEDYIRTCHMLMTAVPDLDSKKHWARQGLKCKPILADLKDKINQNDTTKTYNYELQRFIIGAK